jgi:hypothetical protein
VRFWLEWDRGTMNVRDLVIKFTPYAHYIASREWAREDARLPRLFCVAPDIAQERRMQHVAQTRLAESSGLVLWTTTEVLLKEYGPTESAGEGKPWSNSPGCLVRQRGQPEGCRFSSVAVPAFTHRERSHLHAPLFSSRQVTPPS